MTKNNKQANDQIICLLFTFYFAVQADIRNPLRYLLITE